MVMYGGVSLAIYMNGVTQEFFRMARGCGVYKLIKWLTDSELVVDIVSGTSAGGVNGIYFCYAMANGLDFAAMSQLWRDSGDIQKLLREPNAKLADCQSLLNGDWYLARLEEAFRTMPAYTPGPGDDLSTTGEMDLFVTGTDVDGEVYTVFDDSGHSIDVKDHRSVFWLKHRPGRKAPFQRSEQTNGALAKLARITSCFPAAFQAVHVTLGQTQAGNNHQARVDHKLQQWGQVGREAYFLDGGILDNKPFTHTIRAIFAHPATCPVERILCYVDPDPERFPDRSAHEPDFLGAALDGSFGIPSYQSIAEDLRLIAEHNAQVDRYWHVCKDLRGKLQSAPGQTLPAGAGIPNNIPKAQQLVYARSRMARLGMRAVRGLASRAGQKYQLTPGERQKVKELVDILISLPADPGGEGHREVLTDARSLQRFDVYFRLRRLYHLAFRISEEMEGPKNQPDYASVPGLPVIWGKLNRRIQILEIVQHWMEFLMDRLIDGGRADWRTKEGEDVWGDLRWYMELFLHNARNVAIQPDPNGLRTFYEGLGKEAHAVLRISRNGAGFQEKFSGLLELTDQREEALFAGEGFDVCFPMLRAEYLNFVALDAFVYPMEFVSDLRSTESIRTLRISPVDAQHGFSDRPIEGKLAGATLKHFGGFFKRSWRSNDILWGRLDAISELTEAIVTRERMERIAERPYLRHKVRDRFTDPAIMQALFPHSSPDCVNEIHNWIVSLLDDDVEEAKRNIRAESFDEKLGLLTQMAQLEILLEGLPMVIGDAALEQAEWNRFHVPLKEVGIWSDEQILRKARPLSRFDGPNAQGEQSLCGKLADWTRQDASRTARLWHSLGPSGARLAWWNQRARPGDVTNGERTIRAAIAQSYRDLAKIKPFKKFLPARGFVDPSIAAVAADKFGRAIVADWNEDDPAPKPVLSKVGEFFRREYRVGSENVAAGIPVLVLAEIFTRALLVLRNCLLRSLNQDTRSKITGRMLFRVFFDWPLRTAYWLSRVGGREPVLLSVFEGVITALSVLALILSAMGRHEILLSGTAAPMHWLLLVMLPLAVLIVQFLRWHSNAILRALTLLGLIAVVAIFHHWLVKLPFALGKAIQAACCAFRASI
jgi:patatin-related protein